MKEELKRNFEGDLKLAMNRNIESEITAPTTKGPLKWALEEIELLEKRVDESWDYGFSAGVVWASGGSDDW